MTIDQIASKGQLAGGGEFAGFEGRMTSRLSGACLQACPRGLAKIE
jgi:hypothetical protein